MFIYNNYIFTNYSVFNHNNNMYFYISIALDKVEGYNLIIVNLKLLISIKILQ